MSNDRAALERLFRDSVPGAVHTVLHYLYFLTKESAIEAAVQLRSQGFDTEERLGADGVNWLVLAKHKMIPSEETIAAARMLMENIVRNLSGEYDGWEAEVVRR